MDNIQLIQHILNNLNPSFLNYEEWLHVGMVLKHEGLSAYDWDSWSRSDTGRYHEGECHKKWDSIRGSNRPVTIATLVDIAKNYGVQVYPEREQRELDWDSEISYEQSDDLKVVDHNWLQRSYVKEPGDNWNPTSDLIRYLETLFSAEENVGYVTECWQKDDKFLPKKGAWDRTAGQLIDQLNHCNGDIGAVFGDYKPEVGAWIRFNPLDGNGITDKNVADYRYALIESDNMDIDTQYSVIKELELPVACLVHSGKKSLHAIVKIDATNYEEYRKRVDFLHEVCKKNGFTIDKQNRNPSRLSRMPGIMRNGRKQFLLDTNIGKSNWAEWRDWIESINDDLPDLEPLSDFFDNLPELSPPLIYGVLRQGHKMLLAGPSKAGKSYSLIELCIAIAEGRKWINWDCAKGRVLYVNLELDRASCLHRFKDVYKALNWAPNNISNIDIWNLRGKSVPMDKLAPKLIRRAQKKKYIAVIIDPIYKIITGDENSADQMAHFCNQFDKVCAELGAATIYCHHHSKGSQGGKKSMDRASGSGVFARDPDALLDLLELELNENIIKQETNNIVCQVCIWYLNQYNESALDEISQDVLCMSEHLIKEAKKHLRLSYHDNLMNDIERAKESVQHITAWRIESTLREFPKFKPVNVFFKYPVHIADNSGVLDDLEADSSAPYKKNFSKKKTKEQRKKERLEAVDNAYSSCSFDEKVTVKAMAEYMGKTVKTVRKQIKEHGNYVIENGIVKQK